VNIHDSGYKKLFSNRTIFRQLLQTFVSEAWVQELDFERCETLDKSFVSEHYKETESDLIYKVALHDQEIYIYVLLEFQSSVDRFMALRILNYISSFYMDYVSARQSAEKLPPIFPIVLYNGDRSWTAPLNISELIEQHPSLGEYGLNFQYFKIAENEYSQEALLKVRNIVSTLFLAEAHYDLITLEHELLSLYDAEADKQAVSLFLNWFKQLAIHGRVAPIDYAALEQIYRTKEEVKMMLVTALEKEKQAIYQEGVAQGIEQGIEQGFELGETHRAERIAKEMLQRGFDLVTIAELTGLSTEQLATLRTDESSPSDANQDSVSGKNVTNTAG